MHRNHWPSAKGQVNVKMSTAWNVNTSLAPSEHIIMSWTGTKNPPKKNRKWEKTLKHIPSILTKQMDISIIIYIYKTKIRIYILYIHVYNHTNIKPPSFVVVLGSKHHDMLHRAAKTKFRWTVGSTSWFLKQIMGMFILAKWWKHPHDSPCPYSFPFVEVKSGDFIV